VGYIPPYKRIIFIFIVHTTFLSGLRTTFIDVGYKGKAIMGTVLLITFLLLTSTGRELLPIFTQSSRKLGLVSM